MNVILNARKRSLKGQCHKIFNFWFFSWISSPKLLSIPLGPFQIFSKIRGDIHISRCTTGVVDTGGKWKKSSIIKVLIILFGHLWEVELTYRYIFAFEFTLRSQQPDIVPIICHRCCWHRRQICRRYRRHRWQIYHLYQQRYQNWWQNLLPVVDTCGKFAPVSLIPVGHHDLRISPKILEKNLKWS